MNMKMSRDKNGNKTVVISPEGARGFSIQTNGNLPRTHYDHSPHEDEIINYIRVYGTDKQRAIFGYHQRLVQ